MILRIFFIVVAGIVFSWRCNAQIETESLNLSFYNEPLVKVLKSVKKESGYRLAYQFSDVKGVTVTAVFEEASLDEVMRIVLPNRLSYNLINGIIVIYQSEGLSSGNLQPRRFNFEFSGQIIDFFTGEALPYATLGITSTKDFYQSNQEGKFRIESYPSDTSLVEISYIGYRKLTIRPNQLEEINRNGSIVLKLKPESTVINGAVVESYESTPILSKKEAGLKFVNVLQLPQVTNVGEADALTLVKFLPGFDSSTEDNMGLGTRGFRADENLYYLDGYAIFNPDHFFGLFSSLNSLSIKNMRVLKSAYEPQYGGRSSSLFDITSFDGNNKALSAIVKSGLLSTSARLDGPLLNKKMNFSVSGRTSHVGVFSTSLYEDLFNSVYNSKISFSDGSEQLNAFQNSITPELNFADLQSKLSYKISDKSAIAVSGFYGEDFSKFQILDEDSASNLSIDYLNEFVWQNFGGSVVYSHELTNKLSGKYVAAYSDFISQSNSLEQITFSNLVGVDRTLQSTNENSVRDASFKANWNYVHSDSVAISGGFEINDYQSSLNLFSFGIPVSDEFLEKRLYHVFANMDMNRARYSISAGVRAIYDQTLNEGVLEPRFKGSYDLTKRTSVKLAYGKHNQFIRRLESANFFRGSLDAWRVSGEESVPRSISDHLVAGVHVESKVFMADVEFFSTWQQGAFEDLSLVLSQGNQNSPEFIFGNAQTQGLELTVQKNVKRNNFSVSYALMNSRGEYLTDDGLSLDFRNGRTPRHNLTGLWLWENEHLSFSLSSVFASGKPFTPAIGSYVLDFPNGTFRPFIIFGDLNSALLPNYFRTDVSISWKTMVFNSMNLEISGSVQNLFDRNNINFITYSALGDEFTQNFAILSREVNHLGRLFSIFLTLKI